VTGAARPSRRAAARAAKWHGGGNGVYRYSSKNAFQHRTRVASNYWVDVVFIAP